eukprot:1568248-Pyramimonas_sp.AAC.1
MVMQRGAVAGDACASTASARWAFIFALVVVHCPEPVEFLGYPGSCMCLSVVWARWASCASRARRRASGS